MYKFDSSELSLCLAASLSSSANEGGTWEYRGGMGQEQRVWRAGQKAAPRRAVPRGRAGAAWICCLAHPRAVRSLSMAASVSMHVAVQAGVGLVCWCCLMSAPSSFSGFGDMGNGHSLLLAPAVPRCT